MGIVSSSCRAGYTKSLVLNGRIQEYNSLKELIRQLPFAVEGQIISKKDWVFQRTLTGTSSSATWPAVDSTQFYCPVSSPLTTGMSINTVNGPDTSLNYVQPNFIYIATDSPVKVTFGASATATIFRDPTGPTTFTALNPQPNNINMTTVVNGYMVFTTNNQLKVAPQNVSDLTAWVRSDGTTSTWDGSSNAGIIFPIKVDKSINFNQSQVLIYCAYMSPTANIYGGINSNSCGCY